MKCVTAANHVTDPAPLTATQVSCAATTGVDESIASVLPWLDLYKAFYIPVMQVGSTANLIVFTYLQDLRLRQYRS